MIFRDHFPRVGIRSLVWMLQDSSWHLLTRSRNPLLPATFRPWCLTETFCLTNSIAPKIASVLAMTRPSLITRQWVFEEIDPRPLFPPSTAQIKHLPTPTAIPAHPNCLSLPNTSFAHAQRAVALHHSSPAWMHSQTYLVIHDEEMRVQEQKLQHVPEGLGQTGIECAPEGTHSLSLIFQVYQIMPDIPLCAISSFAPCPRAGFWSLLRTIIYPILDFEKD